MADTRVHSYYATGDVAKVCGVTPGAVRVWEKTGKLVPAARTVSGWALYAPEEVERILQAREERDA